MPTTAETFVAEVLPELCRQARRRLWRLPEADREDLLQQAALLGWKCCLRRPVPARLATVFVRRLLASACRCGVIATRPRGRARMDVSRAAAVGRMRQQSIAGPDRDEDCSDHYPDRRQAPVPTQVGLRIDLPRWLASLPPRHRRAMERFAEGDQAPDIARVVHMDETSVRRLQRRACASWAAFTE